MHFPLAVGAVLTAVLSTASAECTNELGNFYCNRVKSITYDNFEMSGTYNEITGFDGSSCSSKPKQYGGSLAPLNEEHSFHIRGPARLKQFAVYTPGSLFGKREATPSFHERRHGHKHFHAKRTGTEQERVESFGYTPEESETPETPETPDAPEGPKSTKGPKPPAPQSKGSVGGGSSKAGLGEWGRQAYYNSRNGIADGLAFLNHHGGEGSGTFDYELGNSLSYASSDALSGSSSPQVLNDILIPDNKEIIIMSDNECDGDCGVVRPGTVALHGFGGESKLYLFEIEMPKSGNTGFNGDMPAAWILNAQIPRTLQYGKAECSCWKSGCGEFDILEILDSGNNKGKSTFHGLRAGGSSDFFDRPTGGPVKVAVFFDAASSSTHIRILDQDVEFDEIFGLDDILKLVIDSVLDALASVFTLG